MAGRARGSLSPTGVSWFKKKGKESERYGLFFCFEQKKGQAGRGDSRRPIWLSWFIGKKESRRYVFFLADRMGQTGQGVTTTHQSLMVQKKGELIKRGVGRQGNGWPPPAQLSWFISKKSRRLVFLSCFFFRIRGQTGRGMATVRPSLMLSWPIIQEARCCSFFVC